MLAALLLLQDAAPLPELVESWYRLERDGLHAGYLSETYLADTAWTRRFVDGPFVQNDRADLRGGGVKLSSVRPDTAAALDWTPEWPIAQMRSHAFGTFDVRLKAPVLPLELTLFRLRRDGALATPGRITARMLDLDGERPSLRDVAMDVGPVVAAEVFGRRVRLTPVGFPDGCPGLDYAAARLDRYGRIVEGTRRDGSVLKLTEGSTEAIGSLSPGRVEDVVLEESRRDLALRNPALLGSGSGWRRENR